MRDQENHAGHAARARAETNFEKLIDAHHIVFVKRRDEDRAHHESGQKISGHQLRVSVVSQSESLARGAEKSARADFRCEDGCQHRPPWDRPATQREIGDIIVPAAEIRADADDDGEINSDDDEIKPERRHAADTRVLATRSKSQVSGGTVPE